MTDFDREDADRRLSRDEREEWEATELFYDRFGTQEAVEVRRKRLPAQESGCKIDAPPVAPVVGEPVCPFPPVGVGGLPDTTHIPEEER